MQWKVIGSDRDTGDDRVITVDASSEASARNKAGAAGVLATDVVLIRPPVALLAAAAVVTVQPPEPSTAAIVAAGRSLGTSASLLNVFAALAFVAGLPCVVGAYVASDRTPFIIDGLGAFCSGALLLGFASLLAYVRVIGTSLVARGSVDA